MSKKPDTDLNLQPGPTIPGRPKSKTRRTASTRAAVIGENDPIVKAIRELRKTPFWQLRDGKIERLYDPDKEPLKLQRDQQ